MAYSGGIRTISPQPSRARLSCALSASSSAACNLFPLLRKIGRTAVAVELAAVVVENAVLPDAMKQFPVQLFGDVTKFPVRIVIIVVLGKGVVVALRLQFEPPRKPAQ